MHWKGIAKIMNISPSILESHSKSSSKVSRTLTDSANGLLSDGFGKTMDRQLHLLNHTQNNSLSLTEETPCVSPSENSKSKKTTVFTKEQLEYLKSMKDFSGTDGQPINWEADGNLSLTKDQAEYLTSKYDFLDMSKQDYYNFLSELTHMNIISAEDMVSQYVKPIPPGVIVTSGVISSSVRGAFRGMGSSGNIVENLFEYKGNLASMLKWLVKNQSQMNSSQFFFLKDYWERESARCEKFKSIFKMLECI